jgi:hypothetical protein
MWKVQPEDEYLKRTKKWPKKHRREFAAVHSNLDTFLAALNQGAKLEHVKYGFVHPEPRGVLAIDQKGGGTSLKETRLYVFFDTSTQVVHLITLGDKDSQTADVRYASEFVDQLKRREDSDG